jgi:hypothetical protein
MQGALQLFGAGYWGGWQSRVQSLFPETHTAVPTVQTLTRLSAPLSRDSLKATPKSQKGDSPSIDYTELLQHFEKVQKQHLEVRHQRSGRGDHLDRRVVL